MDEFIRSFGTLILVIYSIIQVWLIAFWKKYIRKGEIDIHETGTIEIGYGNFGPTVGLNGTMIIQQRCVCKINRSYDRPRERQIPARLSLDCFQTAEN